MEKQQNLPIEPELKTETGDAYQVPIGGSLGLLALGYSGLMIWREKRAAAEKAKETATAQNVGT